MWYRLGVLHWIVVLLGMGAWGSPAWAETDQVKVENVQVMLSQAGPVVLLKADDRSVAIFVDFTVASSIEGALTGQKFHRPLSHDLMHSILESYAGKVTQVTIHLKGQVYYGDVTISLSGQTKVFDSRSSDAIALAIHFKAPILVDRDLLEKADKEKVPGLEPQLLL